MSCSSIDVIAAPNGSSGHIYATATPIAASAPQATLRHDYPTTKGEIEESSVDELKSQGFTEGLARALAANKDIFPVRFWVVDNSGSMNKPDGHRIIETTKHNNVKIVPCTRWEEIKECVNYHAQMAALLAAPTVFRLLNNPGTRVGMQEFSVAERGDDLVHDDYQTARSIMNKTSPSGLTPLNDHIIYMHERIRAMAPALERDGKKAVIVLATDGLPTDDMGYSSEFASSQFIQSLRLLEGLPVWIVIRLCTDEEDVVNYYNDLDEQLELSLEVLDDFTAEAMEVFEHNSWLNYALPLHRIRELGFHDRVFDLIDERNLTKSELRQFCFLLFGEAQFDGVPDPNVDWLGFLNEIERMLLREKNQWNPLKKKIMPWIDTKQLNKLYGDPSCPGLGCIVQ
uniref:VWFA domain-containing protein n=1 Tax=Trieres chinensis TaxID=1514140 RepID=A0A7S2EWP1_TRICV|mmetsp:Transcript_5909/g.12327  ORF Transcript_5909/g.12327 Transcript_5909/m.12327 type:complete len:399 (+) Transcript_5909:50-1246(+)